MNPSCTTERVLAVIPHLHAAEPGLIDSIVSGSDPALPPPLSEVSADLTAVLWDLQIENTPLGELVPAAEAWRDEDLPVVLVPALVVHRLREHTDMRWSTLLDLRPVDLLAWRNTGPNKVKVLLAFVIEQALAAAGQEPPSTPGPGEAPPTLDIPRQQVLEALAVLGSWAEARGVDGSLTDVLGALDQLPDPPADAVAILGDTPVNVFADPAHRLRFDPDAAAEALLSRFDDRERDVLERLLALNTKARRKLEQIAVEHGVTREWIRQIETKAKSKLEQYVHLREVKAFADRARELREQVGRACPVDALPTELRPDTQTLRDELYAWAAGPYRLEGDWLVTTDVSVPVLTWCATLLDAIDPGTGVVELDALEDALRWGGVRPEHHQALIEQSSGVRLLGDKVLRWSGTLGDKAEVILRLHGVPMEADELNAAIGEGHAVTSLRNVLTEPRFTRRTKTSFGLTEWGGEQYTTIVSMMRTELEAAGGPLEISALGASLAERFGIAASSPGVLAHTSPVFVAEGNKVRLRGPDEPYVPTGSLELTARCFVIDGAWAWMTPVNHDVLRGSGLAIPETFAVHLGLQPEAKGKLAIADGSIRVGWGAQAPYIGSLRRIAEQFDADEGDLLFVRRATPSSLDFRLARAADLAGAAPATELLLRVGAAPTSADVIAALGSAIGLGGAVRPQIHTLEARLSERREHHLVELLHLIGDPATAP